MKPIMLFSIFFVLSSTNFAQEKSTPKSLTAKGNQFVGVGISPVYSDMFYSYTDLTIQKGNSSIGLLAMGHYGKFVADNFMIGGFLTTGFHYSRNSMTSFIPAGAFPGTTMPVTITYTNRINDFDISLAPFARYYVPFNKRGTFSLFLQGAIPYVYSTNTIRGDQNINGSMFSNKSSLTFNSLRGSIGFGLAVKTNFGSVDTHVSNMGWFISFNKQLKRN